MRKVFVVHYPPGRSKVDGVWRDNASIARRLLDTVDPHWRMRENSQLIISDVCDDGQCWRVELVEISILC